MADLNQEILRKRLLEIYEEYVKSKGNTASINEIKKIVKEYDEIRELLHETLNIALGILEAIANKEINNKEEEKQLIKEITEELNQRSYLGGVY
jgi:ferritin